MEEKVKEDHVDHLEHIVDLILDGTTSNDLVRFTGLSQETCDWILEYYHKYIR